MTDSDDCRKAFEEWIHSGPASNEMKAFIKEHEGFPDAAAGFYAAWNRRPTGQVDLEKVVREWHDDHYSEGGLNTRPALADLITRPKTAVPAGNPRFERVKAEFVPTEIHDDESAEVKHDFSIDTDQQRERDLEFNLPTAVPAESEHRQEMRFVDATPDSGYPMRILQAHMDQGSWSDNTLGLPPDNPLVIKMNGWQEERNRLILNAISKLNHPAESANVELVEVKHE